MTEESGVVMARLKPCPFKDCPGDRLQRLSADEEHVIERRGRTQNSEQPSLGGDVGPGEPEQT
jgi:hypothetical protein